MIEYTKKGIEYRLGDGDCFLVTGSIGPQYHPKLFSNFKDAQQYAKIIVRFGKAEKVYPMFKPCIESRFVCNMPSNMVLF